MFSAAGRHGGQVAPSLITITCTATAASTFRISVAPHPSVSSSGCGASTTHERPALAAVTSVPRRLIDSPIHAAMGSFTGTSAASTRRRAVDMVIEATWSSRRHGH